ncbi:putative C2 domain-containing protein [Medicago truncatula]|nr:putative C2 domain-containing protein [Medicago truncatula]
MKNTDRRWKEVQFTAKEPPTENDVLNVEVVDITSSNNPLQQKESLGYVNIHLGDVVSKKSINEKYHLENSKNGWIQIELQ